MGNNYPSICMGGIIYLSLSISTSVYYNFPGFYGVDPWFHSAFAQDIADAGIVPPETNYSPFPGMHIIVALSIHATNLGLKDAYFLIAVIHAVSVVFTYLIAEMFFSKRIAIVAAFILAVSNFFLYWSFWISSTSFGTILFGVLLYLWLRFLKEPQVKTLVVILPVVFTLNITHSLSSFVTWTITTAMVIAAILSSRYLSPPTEGGRKTPLGVPMVFGFTMFGYWIFAYTYAGGSFVFWATKAVRRMLTSDLGRTDLITRSGLIDPVVNFLNNGGFFIFLSLTVAGFIYLVARSTNRVLLALLGGSIVPFVAVYGGGALGANAIMPHRWFIFGYTLAAPFAAFGLFGLLHRMSWQRGLALGTAVMVVFVGSMAINNWANSDSPVWDLPTNDRYGFKASELSAAEFALAKMGSPVKTDFWFANVLGLETPIFKTFPDAEGPFLLRDYVKEHAISLPVRGGFYVTEHKKIPDGEWAEFRSDKGLVYSSGSSVILLSH